MTIDEAFEASTQILLEERQRPTVMYDDISVGWFLRTSAYSAEDLKILQSSIGKPKKSLIDQRNALSRDTTDTPQFFQLQSENYELLMAVFGQIDAESRPALMEMILEILANWSTPAVNNPSDRLSPSFDGYISEFPLIAEFAIRSGFYHRFFETLSRVAAPSIPLAILMVYLEEFFSLQWNIFSDAQLKEIPALLSSLRALSFQHSSLGDEAQQFRRLHNSRLSLQREANQIVRSIDNIIEHCKRARYFYLRGILRQSINVEIENDKREVEEFLVKLGFSLGLRQSLNEAEKGYRDSATPFDLKNSLGHLRSFLEHLHLEAAKHIAITTTIPATPHDWDTSTAFLRKNDYITFPQEKLSRGIHQLISDEGAHPLMAERVFARVSRQVVIEYGFMFLTIMNAQGIKLTSAS